MMFFKPESQPGRRPGQAAPQARLRTSHLQRSGFSDKNYFKRDVPPARRRADSESAAHGLGCGPRPAADAVPGH